MSSNPKRNLRKAERLFETFHSYDPIKVGSFHRQFRIPREASHVGEATVMYYMSDKLNPISGKDEGWIPYFHEHGGGVRMYIPGDIEGVELRKIPKWIWNTEALVRLGDCDGFEFVDFDDNVVKAKATGTKPEWYCTPSGKALLVIQSKRSVLALAWGGTLSVGWRGVVG